MKHISFDKQVFLCNSISALVFGLLLFSSCSDSLHERAFPEGTDVEDGMGVVQLNIVNTTRTLAPAIVFSHYELVFSAPEKQSIPFSANSAVTTVTIAAGEWNLAVKGFISSGEAIAEGNATLQITPGELCEVQVRLVPITAEGSGSFFYNLVLPDGLSAATLTFTALDNDYEETVDLLAAVRGSIASIPSGYYLLKVELYREGKKAVKTEVAHIYHNQTTRAEYNLSTLGFGNVEPENTVSITINPGQDWDLVAQAQSVIQGTLIPFSVPEGYTIRQWYLDGQPQGDNSTYTFDAQSKEAGDVYELAVVVIDNSGAQRSGTCRITIVSIPVPVPVPVPEDFVSLSGATVTGSGSEGVFAEGRTVEISPFAMAKYETTYELWYEVRVWAVANGYTFANQGRNGYQGTTNHPVTEVNWRDVIVWCNAYSEKENRYPVYTYSGAVIKDATDSTACDNAVMDKRKSGFRLPTEVEWEFAARGGNPGDTTNWGYTYPGSNTIENVAWYESNSGRNTHPVGTKAANSAVLYDMSGNVWEWCWDWYGSSVSSSTPADGVIAGSYRVLRGGHWGNDAYNAGVSCRNYGYPSVANDFIGFRVVCPPSS